MRNMKSVRPAPHSYHRALRPSGSSPPDYGTYQFTRKELIQNTALYLVLDAMFSFLFYRSFIVFVIFLPGVYLFLKSRRIELNRQRSRKILAEFTTGMQMVNASLQAGYAMENAFREATAELRRIYPEDSFIMTEFRYILTRLRLNVPVESLLMDLGRRTHIEDIIHLAEVFQTAKRTGGDMIGIIRGAVTSIQAKAETREEIETNLSGKVSEQKIMSAAPLAIIAYTTLTSPGFLDVCYHSTLGSLIMTGALAIYAAAYLWGKKIMQIEV